MGTDSHVGIFDHLLFPYGEFKTRKKALVNSPAIFDKENGREHASTATYLLVHVLR